MCIWKLVLYAFIGFGATAKALVLDLPADTQKLKFLNIYEDKKLIHPLSVWRRSEVDGQWDSCVKKGPSLLNKNKVLEGWILSVFSKCVYESLQKSFDQNVLFNFYTLIESRWSVVQKGPWQNLILSNSQKIAGLSVSFIEKKIGNNKKAIRKTLEFLDLDDQLFIPMTRKWYLDETENSPASLNLVSRQKPSTKKFDDEVSDSLGKKITAIDDLKKWDSLEIISNIEPAIQAIKSSYRKMEYDKVVLYSPLIKEVVSRSELYSDYLIHLGRSQHILGDYQQAQDTFELIIKNHKGTSDYEEALLRAGLISLRQGEFKKANKYFEILVALDREKYNITGRYWWLRSLEQTNDSREVEEKTKFVNDFPFSYYGMKVKGEIDGGQLSSGPSAPVPSVKWQLRGQNLKVWQRFIALAKVGWVLEAQHELNGLVWPQNPLITFHLSELVSKASIYPMSVRMLTPLLESFHEVRSVESLKKIYPTRYSEWIQSESKKYKLNSNLVYSLIRQESSFGLKALSTSQAAGLMQMIQPTALEVAERLKIKIVFPDDLYKPEVNVPMGTFYIAQVIKEMNGHVPLALAGYNAGPHRIKTFMSFRDSTKKVLSGDFEVDWRGVEDLWIDELPWSETTGYVKSILRNTLVYELIEKKEIKYKADFWRDFLIK